MFEHVVALARRGVLTPTSAAAHTGLTVDGAAQVLEELADRGHLTRRHDHGFRTYALPGLEALLPSGGGPWSAPYPGRRRRARDEEGAAR